MEETEKEIIGFDLSFEVEAVIYAALETTISHSIDEEMKKDGTPMPVLTKEMMLKNILSRNIDGLENEQYITLGAQNKVYLCGGWLMRPVFSNGQMIPMMEHIRTHMDTTNIVFCPEKTGIGLRKEMWFAKNEDYPSYDLPNDCRLEPVEVLAMSGTMGMPPMAAGGPPPNMAGRRPPAGFGGPPPGAMGRHGMAGRPPFPPQ